MCGITGFTGKKQATLILLARLTSDEIHFYNIEGDGIEKQSNEITWDAEAAEKGGYAHFMIKEINEQPKAVADTIAAAVKNGRIDLSSVGLSREEM